ncbi:MAG: 1,6-anhydro-N-acetylmuramyl-L-alanine amidase AmpD [Candidatus Competibacteraceae bacterium]|nr:1,6-anhydro-N-acetylmuramyl-L-alanine amidase AmpD [Candidatus Competibacteraceae bacterium]
MDGPGQLPLVIDAAGWLDGVRRLPSPNCDDRPGGMEPELVVVHGISLPPGRFGGPWIDDLFTNRLDPRVDPYFAQIQGLRVSAHLLIRRDGTAVQYVSLLRRAWHAGVSEFQGRVRCNDFAIGIELEGTDTLPYEPHQYQTLARLIGAIRERWPAIDRARIVGHCHIAPGRKTDPGTAFDWSQLWQMLDNSKHC